MSRGRAEPARVRGQWSKEPAANSRKKTTTSLRRSWSGSGLNNGICVGTSISLGRGRGEQIGWWLNGD
eukprot:1703699-Lingulodinium_polyedra.AAC.1